MVLIVSVEVVVICTDFVAVVVVFDLVEVSFLVLVNIVLVDVFLVV